MLRIRLILGLLLTSLAVILTPFVSFADNHHHETVVYFYWGIGCPHCEDAKPFLERLKEAHPALEIRSLETWRNQENAEIFQQMAAAYGTRAAGVPAFFIGDHQPIFGYSVSLEPQITRRILTCLEQGCVNPASKAGIESPAEDKPLSKEIKQNSVCVHLFFRPVCPHCVRVESFLDSIERDKNVNIHKHNVEQQEANELYELFKKRYGLTQASHPIIFVGDTYFIGEKSIQENLTQKINYCLDQDCPCPTESILGTTPIMPHPKDITPEPGTALELPLFGAIDLKDSPIFVTTAIIAFVDGFNPCSLWLIMFLLGIVIHSGSRRKILVVASTFLAVTASAYGLFILGLLNVFMYVAYMDWITIAIAMIALVFAAVNIKDYFWFQEGISFTISDKHKPGIYKKMRSIMAGDRGYWSMIVGTAALALGVVLVELPCTAGFPVIWTNILAQQGVQGGLFAALFSLYILIYLCIEIAIVLTVVVTLKASRFEEKHGRILKLVGGTIMAALAVVMLFAPELFHDLAGVIWVFLIAIIASALIIVLHRLILPRFGIVIGSEKDLLQ